MLAIVDSNPKKQCVLVVDNGLLLGAGIVHLLSDEARFCVVAVRSFDGAALLKIIQQFQPDTVILDEICLLALSLRHLVELLNHPRLRVITINVKDDRVQVCYKQQLQIIRVTDLVHLIRGSKKMVTDIPLTGSGQKTP